MNKLILFIFSVFISAYSYAQCTADYDFGDGVEFGVSPNPADGENFATGETNVAYSDIIHMLVPTNAGDINEALDGYVIDSLELTGVSVLIDGSTVDISTIGLDVVCNNNGDLLNPCSFLGGEQYCAVIEGTPTQVGSFPLTINVLGHLLVFGAPQAVPYFFDQYTLTIYEEGTTSITKVDMPTLEMNQNVPNPFKNKTTINYTLNTGGKTHFIVRNLLGEVIFDDMIDSKRGRNSYQFDSTMINSGIYMYSMEMNGSKITKRMVINK